ncbi:MAG: endolytic transglycosylase MltG [Deltaproteobacteria bacterium]|nr:endolytic transglycosylase MltG [Deltaproteobacteria bacterium]
MENHSLFQKIKTWLIRLFVVCCTLLLAISLVVAIKGYQFTSTAVAPNGDQVILIPQGASFERIAQQLEQARIIKDKLYFTWMARWQGKASLVQAGEYLFNEPATPQIILQRLVSGDVRKIQITFPEGLAIKEIAQKVEAAGIGTSADFIALAKNSPLAEKFNIPTKSLEGYLFPETYTLQSTTTSEQLIKAMVIQFNRHLSDDLLVAAQNHGLNRHQLVTLASIIQKETGVVGEMPLISAVFHNRLKGQIPLQADPTVIYGIDNFDGNLTRKHLETPTPYNTYRKRGLPPGPIANPGKMALQAAAYPADATYLYFVARGDGTHEFSRSLKEHNRAVQKFQLRR